MDEVWDGRVTIEGGRTFEGVQVYLDHSPLGVCGTLNFSDEYLFGALSHGVVCELDVGNESFRIKIEGQQRPSKPHFAGFREDKIDVWPSRSDPSNDSPSWVVPVF